jgi:hypothetical protein
MREPVVAADIARKSSSAVDTPTSWVCLALGLSILILALRIISVW